MDIDSQIRIKSTEMIIADLLSLSLSILPLIDPYVFFNQLHDNYCISKKKKEHIPPM